MVCSCLDYHFVRGKFMRMCWSCWNPSKQIYNKTNELTEFRSSGSDGAAAGALLCTQAAEERDVTKGLHLDLLSALLLHPLKVAKLSNSG